MSLRNIVVGLLCGFCLLAGGFAASWRLSIHPLWIPFAIYVLAAFVFSIPEERRQRLFPQRFWDRACTGIRWRRHIPAATASQICEFLDILVDAFAFPQKRRSCFSHDDKVVEIHRGLYPDRFMADGLELETLVLRLRKRYGIDAASFWSEDITLGELFTQIRVA
jgi:propanediol dehydratase small subunit